MIMTVKGILNGIWQFCRYLFWPQWGSKRRLAQEEYERMLEEADEAMQSNYNQELWPKMNSGLPNSKRPSTFWKPITGSRLSSCRRRGICVHKLITPLGNICHRYTMFGSVLLLTRRGAKTVQESILCFCS